MSAGLTGGRAGGSFPPSAKADLTWVGAVSVMSSPSRIARTGTFVVPAAARGLPRDSVGSVIARVTLDKTDFGLAVGQLPASPNEADQTPPESGRRGAERAHSFFTS